MANSHNIIEYSTKWADGSITQKQRDFLVRHGIGEREAKLIDSQREENMKITDRVAYEDAKFVRAEQLHRQFNEILNKNPNELNTRSRRIFEKLGQRGKQLALNTEPDDLRFQDFLERSDYFKRQISSRCFS